MKKNSLFKGVSMLGAVLLLINLALPGFVAYAQVDDQVPGDGQEAATQYNFTSYGDEDGDFEATEEDLYATGTVEELGEAFTNIMVLANSEADWIGQTFSITSNAVADREDTYQLYGPCRPGACPMDVRVKIYSELPDGREAVEDADYYFTSYGDEEGDTEYATGAVEVNGSFTKVSVLTNSVEGWEGEEFYIQSDAKADDTTLYPIYKMIDGNLTYVNILVSIAPVENEEEEQEATVIDTIAITGVTEPVDGATATIEGIAINTEGLEYDANNTYWYEAESDEPINEDDEDDEDTVYNFTSYGSAEGGDAYAEGTVTVSDIDYTQVTVTTNTVEGWVDRSFLITSDALTDGENRYPIYEAANGTLEDINVRVSITPSEEDGVYNFTSYGSAEGGDAYAEGTVTVSDIDYTQVTVTTNTVEGWVDRSFLITSDALTDGENRYPIYEAANGTLEDINVRVSITPSEEEDEDDEGYGAQNTDDEIADDEGEDSDEPITFKEGKTYYLHVEYSKGEGYELAENHAYTVNGTAKLGEEIDTEDETYAVEFEYTATAKPSSSRSSGGGGGGSSKKSSKASTGDTVKGNTNNSTNDGTNSNTNDGTIAGNDSNTTNSQGNSKSPVITNEDIEKYGQEQIDAYKWAYENGITTMESVDAARLDQPLTRAELAKMMVVYVAKILKKSTVVKETVTYKDVNESLGDLAGYIVLAYQYQIMGINADGTPLEYFNPNGEVTRGEYATVFSRVLFGNAFNQEGEEFYAGHIEALKTAGILKDTNPTMKEMRGWVMLMMYRSSQNAEEIAKIVKELGATEKEAAKAEAKSTTEEAAAMEETIKAEQEATQEATEEKAEPTTEENAETATTEEKVETAEATATEEKTDAEAKTGDVAEAPAETTGN